MRAILAVLMLSTAIPALAEDGQTAAQRHEQQVDAGIRAIDLVAANGWTLIRFWAHGIDERTDEKSKRYYALAENNFFMSLKAMDFFPEP